jgi:hypothetical protein
LRLSSDRPILKLGGKEESMRGRSWLPAAFLALVLACGGDDDDDCIKCNPQSATGSNVCPHVVKQCSYGTIDVQSCSGVGTDGCCATSPDEVGCAAPFGDTAEVELVSLPAE